VHLKQLQDEQKEVRERALHELERVSGMTLGEAKSAMLERSQDLVRTSSPARCARWKEEARGEARRRARALVADALQRVAASTPRRRP
jgi:ribonuclease Y